MRISQIKFDNWRCFNGEQTVLFSTDRLKPVSVVYGTNGSGKTTILNGALWALWNITTADFKLPKELVSKTALAAIDVGRKVTGSVELKFEHAGCKYTVLRTCTEINKGNDQSMQDSDQMRIERIDLKGEYSSWTNEEGFDLINQMFPGRLAKYFFFNGERFTSDVTSTIGQKDFGQAVRHVLGLTAYERALQHSKRAIDELDISVSKLDNNKELEGLEIDKEKTKDEINRLELQIENNDQKIKEYDLLVMNIDAELKKYEQIKASIVKREELELKVKQIGVTINKFADDLTALTGRQSTSLFLLKHDKEIIRLGEVHRRHKHIPANFQESFIRDLLNSGLCICGEPLKLGDDHYNKVRDRLNEGSLTDTEDEWTLLVNEMKKIRNKVKEFNSSFRQIEANRRVSKDELANVGVEISRINNFIASLGGGELKIEELEIERAKTRTRLDTANKKMGGDTADLEREKRALKDITLQISQVEPKNSLAKLERQRGQLLRVVIEKLEQDLLALKSKLLKDLETSVTRIYRRLSATNFVARLNEYFVLTMHRDSEIGEPVEVALGAGDTQLSFYSFIAALSEIDFSLYEARKIESFPIMIDAPFSLLDKTQKERVTATMPRVTHQLILMMLEEHNEPMKSHEILNITPNTTVLVLNSNNSDVSEEFINLPQHQGLIPYCVKTEATHNYTSLVQIQ